MRSGGIMGWDDVASAGAGALGQIGGAAIGAAFGDSGPKFKQYEFNKSRQDMDFLNTLMMQQRAGLPGAKMMFQPGYEWTPELVQKFGGTTQNPAAMAPQQPTFGGFMGSAPQTGRMGAGFYK